MIYVPSCKCQNDFFSYIQTIIVVSPDTQTRQIYEDNFQAFNAVAYTSQLWNENTIGIRREASKLQ